MCLSNRSRASRAPGALRESQRALSPPPPSSRDSPSVPAMFAHETPSRVLRRIQDLEDQQDELPSLPDLPSFDDSNGSLSPSSVHDSFNQTPAPRTPPASQTNDLQQPSPAPYTSTPAPSSGGGYYRSQSTIAPSTGNSTLGKGVASTGPLSQHRPELFEHDASAITRVESGDEDGMLVFSGSGSGGEESTRPPTREHAQSDDEQDDNGAESDRTTSTAAERRLHAYFDNDSDVPTAPIDPSPPDYEPASERARRLSAAADHIATRRPVPKRKSSAAAVPLPPSPAPEDDSSDADDRAPSAKGVAVAAGTPLRELSNAPRDSTYGSPGVGRHASPVPSPHALEHPLEPYTPGTHRSSPASSNPSPFYSTPLVDPSRSDAERRKAHVLSTLRSTAKPHFVSHRKSPLSATPGPAGRDDESIGSDGTSNDLTTLHKGNTSLPSGGVGGVTDKSTRFNGAKLNAYLHSLNTHLTEENQSLVSTLGESNRELKRLRKDKHRLEAQVKEMSVLGSSVAPSGDESEKEEQSRVERLERQLEGLVESHQGINGLKQQLGDELGDAATLAAQVERLENALREKDSEVAELRERVVESREPGSPQADLVSALQREVFALKDELGEVAAERDASVEELERLRGDVVALNERVDGLLADLEEKDAEVDEANRQLQEQDAGFADKMQTLEVELSRVMEQQEEQLARAREESQQRNIDDEAARVEDARKLADARRNVDELERALDEVRDERDRLERQIVDAGAAPSEIQAVVQQLRDEVATLESTLVDKDDEIVHLHSSLDEFERKVDELDADDTEAKRQLAAQAESLQQMEDALDESAQQLLQNEDELEQLRGQLASERAAVSSLKAQISQLSLHKTKAKSPLANEAYNHATDPVVAALEDDLEDARAEVDQLKARLAAADRRTVEIKDAEIRTLKSHKHDLEERVTSLRQQVLTTPSKTPDKSMLFRSIIGVQTPKTPGHFMSNLPSWSPGSADGDATISPLLAQIHELEQIVERLQIQLADANDEIDHKLNKLEAAGSGTIALARQLADARERIALFEAELDRLLGEHGSLHRVRTRLTTVSCPDCRTTFDANKEVKLRIDRTARSVSVDESDNGQAPQVSQSLREALAGVNAKLSQLKLENSVLQDAADRSKALAAEKSNLTRQHASLQKDFDQARVEIAGLEGELRTERDRVRTLSNEAAITSRTKSSLEARLHTAETELRNVKRDLSSAGAPDALDRLRREKDSLVSERADLLQRLSAETDKASRADRHLTTSKSAQADLESQLERHLTEIRDLRASLEAKNAAHRTLADERADILRGVAGLQSDLNRVRQDAISLGLDLAAVRRERDAMGVRADGAVVDRLQDEVGRLRRMLGVFEEKVKEHVCPSDANALGEMKARHADEAKGLLAMIRYLKVRVTREATFRTDLSYQKHYLGVIVRQKQSSIDSTLATLAQLGLPSRAPTSRKPKLTFRGAAQAMVAVARMNILSRKWQNQSVPKTRLRTQAYPDARGRPFVP